MTGKSILFFDLDGCLAMNYTHPEQHYPSIKHTLQQLHDQGHILCLASFNPRAEIAVESWGIAHLFSAARAGCNWKWSGKYRDIIHQFNIRKSSQIHNMLFHELREEYEDCDDLYFYDDDPKNIQEVNTSFPSVKCVLVDNKIGFVGHKQHKDDALK